MSLIKKDSEGFSTIRSVFSDLFDSDKFFDHDFFKKETHPAINIKEKETHFDVEVACPGFDKEDFNITLEKDFLTISANHKSEKEDTEGHYARKEFNYSSFSRSFNLPENTDEDNVKATYQDGILKLQIAKIEATPKVKKKVEIT